MEKRNIPSFFFISFEFSKRRRGWVLVEVDLQRLDSGDLSKESRPNPGKSRGVVGTVRRRAKTRSQVSETVDCVKKKFGRVNMGSSFRAARQDPKNKKETTH